MNLSKKNYWFISCWDGFWPAFHVLLSDLGDKYLFSISAAKYFSLDLSNGKVTTTDPFWLRFSANSSLSIRAVELAFFIPPEGCSRRQSKVWLQNQWQSPWSRAPAQHYLVSLAGTNTGSFLVCSTAAAVQQCKLTWRSVRSTATFAMPTQFKNQKDFNAL